MTDDATQHLLETDLLQGVPAKVLQNLSPPPERIAVKAGDFLIREGEMGTAYFLLVHGRLRAFAAVPGGRVTPVGDILPGEGVGEMSLLTDEPTTATVRAVHDSELIRFSRESYLKLMGSSPAAAIEVARSVIRRIRGSRGVGKRSLPYRRIVTLAIDPGVDLAAFNKTLTNSLGEHAATACLSAASLGEELSSKVGQSNALSEAAAASVDLFLQDLEKKQDITVYDAGSAASVWAGLALKRADIVLLVGAAGGDVAQTAAEQAFLSGLDPDLAARVDLVLLHGEDWVSRPDTDLWLAERRIGECHHLRRTENADTRRLARKLAGRAVGLVLDGGGALGLAQIGVLKAFEKADIPIDRIAGVGMGALVGALYAAGNSPDRIAEICREIWIDGKPLSDYTFPALAVIRGRRLRMLFHNAFADRRVEDLPIGFFCVSGNLSKVDAEIHERGPLWKVVAASCSVIGAGPPVFMNGDVLVDGEALANVPGDVMRGRFGGIVVESKVSAETPMQVSPDMAEAPSGWYLLLRKLVPLRAPIALPGFLEVMTRTATLSGRRQSRLSHSFADETLRFPLNRFSETDFAALDEIVEAGFAMTAQHLHETRNGPLADFGDLTGLPPMSSLRSAEDLYAVYAARQITERRQSRRRAIAAMAAIVVVLGTLAIIRGDHKRIADLWSGFREAAGPKGALAVSDASTLDVRKHDGANVLPVNAVTLVAQGGYDTSERYAGQVVSRRSSSLAFEQSGTLIEVLVDDGDQVSAGAVLARTDTRHFEARQRELAAELKHSQALRDQTKARLELANLTEKRRSELLRRNNVSRQSYDESLFDEKALESELLANTAAVEQAAAALERVQLDIAKSEIHAPFDGVIVERLLDEGTVVDPGSPVIRMIEAGVKQVRVGIPVSLSSELVIGRPYDVEAGGRTVAATLKAVLPSLSAETRTVPLVLQLSDPDMVYQSGQLARLRFERRIAMDGFWVPATALIGGRRGLWNAYALEETEVQDLMRISLREVQVLHSDGDRVFVRGTLQDGDRLVSTGLQRLVPGQFVQVTADKK